MGTVPWPYEQPNAWQTIALGGHVFPGLAAAKVKGGQKIDRKDGPGSDGEATTLQGEKAKDVDITIRCWEAEQQFDLEDLTQRVLEPKIGKRGPLDIAHPACSFRRVSAILVETIEGPDWDGEKGFLELKIKGIEHKPPPPKNATKASGDSATTAGVEWEEVKAVGAEFETARSTVARSGVRRRAEQLIAQTRKEFAEQLANSAPSKTVTP